MNAGDVPVSEVIAADIGVAVLLIVAVTVVSFVVALGVGAFLSRLDRLDQGEAEVRVHPRVLPGRVGYPGRADLVMEQQEFAGIVACAPELGGLPARLAPLYVGADR